jgi:hypothetical protein
MNRNPPQTRREDFCGNGGNLAGALPVRSRSAPVGRRDGLFAGVVRFPGSGVTWGERVRCL